VEGLDLNSNNSVRSPAPAPPHPHPHVRSNWATGLMGDIQDPSKIVLTTSTVVVLRDKFPKAKHHYLVLPKEKIDTPSSLTRDNLDLLREMEDVAKEIITRHPDDKFKMGFHATPSMLQLHLHVISEDYQSVYMKKPIHWNSFNTEYFLSLTQVRGWLEAEGKISVEKKKDELMSSQMNCNKCQFKTSNFFNLKSHLNGHASRDEKGFRVLVRVGTRGSGHGGDGEVAPATSGEEEDSEMEGEHGGRGRGRGRGGFKGRGGFRGGFRGAGFRGGYREERGGFRFSRAARGTRRGFRGGHDGGEISA